MTIAPYLTLYAAGLLSFLSPCVLPLLPSYLSVLGGAAHQADAAGRGRLRRAGLGFALGLSLVFVAFGMGTSVLSHALTAYRRPLMIAIGALMVLFGAKLVGVLRSTTLDTEARPLLARVPSPGGFWGGLLFGAAFSLGWTPCVGPILGATLSYAASQSASPLRAASELATYALGLSTPLIAATFAVERVLGVARQLRSWMQLSQRAVGAVLIVLGALIATDKLGAAVPSATADAAGKPCDAPGATACAVKDAEIAGETEADVPTGRPHLVEFVSGHCTTCARMAPLVAKLEHHCTNHDGTLVRANVESSSGGALARRFEVHAVPTFLQLDAEGKEVERVIGEQTIEQLTLALQSVRGRACPAL